MRLHPYFKQVIQELNKAVKARVTIMNGKFSLNFNGPMKGEPVELNWALVTDNIGAGARLACKLMQIPLEQIGYLKYAQKLEFTHESEQIKVNCDLRPPLKDKFILKRGWTDLRGFLAFRSPVISYLAYFSRLAGLLHWIMYIFRKPFYDYQEYAMLYKPRAYA